MPQADKATSEGKGDRHAKRIMIQLPESAGEALDYIGKSVAKAVGEVTGVAISPNRTQLVLALITQRALEVRLAEKEAVGADVQ